MLIAYRQSRYSFNINFTLSAVQWLHDLLFAGVEHIEPLDCEHVPQYNGRIPLWEKWNDEIFYTILWEPNMRLLDRGLLIAAFTTYRGIQYNQEIYRRCICYGQANGF